MPDSSHVGAARRRSPRPEERQRDADRSRQAILDAARSEFADHGFAGARVSAIAERAGVNKQLISYYFGGKDGVYRAVLDQWHEVEARHRAGAQDLAGLVVAYLRANHEQPELARILLWEGLSGAAGEAPPPGADPPIDRDLADLVARQSDGLVPDDVDPGLLLLALMGAVAAPTMLSHLAEQVSALDPSSDEFLEAYARQLAAIVRRLVDRQGSSQG